jgi:hypothetical protein
MITKKGFTQLFWEDFKQLQNENNKITHAEVYEKLEIEYKSEFKQRRYSNFKSFRTRRDK